MLMRLMVMVTLLGTAGAEEVRLASPTGPQSKGSTSRHRCVAHRSAARRWLTQATRAAVAFATEIAAARLATMTLAAAQLHPQAMTLARRHPTHMNTNRSMTT